MYDLQDWAAVQRVYKQTRSKRATAKILGMSRNTVRSLLEEKEAPVYKRTVYKSKIDGFKEQIIEWRCEPFLFNGTRIFRELKARGYTGSIGPVYRYLSKIEEDIKDHISSKATVINIQQSITEQLKKNNAMKMQSYKGKAVKPL